MVYDTTSTGRGKPVSRPLINFTIKGTVGVSTSEKPGYAPGTSQLSFFACWDLGGAFSSRCCCCIPQDDPAARKKKIAKHGFIRADRPCVSCIALTSPSETFPYALTIPLQVGMRARTKRGAGPQTTDLGAAFRDLLAMFKYQGRYRPRLSQTGAKPTLIFVPPLPHPTPSPPS